MKRRQALQTGVKIVALSALGIAVGPVSLLAQGRKKGALVFNVLDFGAVGDGKTPDTEAIQKAINEATKAGKGARVLVKGGRKYLIGTLDLKPNIDFHLEGDAELLVSTNQNDYTAQSAAIIARDAHNLTISGTGSINGRALEFMTHFDEANEWWIPKEWRPKLFILTACHNLKVRDITIAKAPSWSLHMMGCENVLVDNIKIRNHLDVPNCDGIDPDHCRHVDIRNCHIVCGDDAIVIKATRQKEDFGPSANITVRDCLLETQDSGVKIGTETTQDIYNVTFERCEIKTSCRGLTIQLRDEGNVRNIEFKDITFVSRYHSAPWWGRGEAISFTAIPRTPQSKIGVIENVKVKNVKGRAENSVRLNGTKESRLKNVTFENVDLTFERWTRYPGGLFDNRPTTAYPDIEPHRNPGFYLRFADGVTLKNCTVKWGKNLPDYYSHALEAHDVTGLKLKNFKGEAAHPTKFNPISIKIES
ncbi:glycoside hydrolase family 28 protein [Rufibacter glacialis]|uniref:Glycoside hydrolase n=1 Tax=Rufibacter glacialis TaxID=1259555 RepID=A0A5M8Q8Y1_9BACT|nr:glycosyl hydrolase family 28 protein [Rufibacter glacialis]KAA6432329.1 glycoside hydrolase [Rufibacter glacialis]GGK77766.1 polygalacturonase [Rufibacter glacialis]